MGCMTQGIWQRFSRVRMSFALVGIMMVCVPMLHAAESGPEDLAARLSAVDGQVRVLVAGEPVVDQALVNLPVSVGTEIVTGDDGRAEIEFEDGTVARIAPNSGLRVIALRGSGGQSLQLEAGLGYFETRTGKATVRFGAAVAQIDSSTLLRLRLDVAPGEAAVLAGVAEIKLDKGTSFTLAGGQSAMLNVEDPNGYTSTTLVRDSWDSWNQDRDQSLASEAANAPGALAIDNGSPAWSDLDANGSWYSVPGSGQVWSPRVASAGDWEPYGCGHWVWTPRFGYVWVSCWHWGFLPYMCGNWDFYDGFGWGWSPYGCGGGWGGGFFTTVRVRRGPPGYLPLPHPGPRPRRPIGGPRPPHPPVIPIDRKWQGHDRWPDRGREVPIGGTVVRPLPLRPPSEGGAGDHPRDGFPRVHPGPPPIAVTVNPPTNVAPPAHSTVNVPPGPTPAPVQPPMRRGFWQDTFRSNPPAHATPAPGGGAPPVLHPGEPRIRMNAPPQNTPRGPGSMPAPVHVAPPSPQHGSAPPAPHFSAPPPVHVSAPASSGGGNQHK